LSGAEGAAGGGDLNISGGAGYGYCINCFNALKKDEVSING